METFKQIARGPVWDGDLVSKSQRDRLKSHGLIERGYGYNWLTVQGINVAVALELISPRSGDAAGKEIDALPKRPGGPKPIPAAGSSEHDALVRSITGPPIPPTAGVSFDKEPHFRAGLTPLPERLSRYERFLDWLFERARPFFRGA